MSRICATLTTGVAKGLKAPWLMRDRPTGPGLVAQAS